MRRIIQHPLTWCLAMAGLGLLLPGGSTALGDKAAEMKAYVEIIPGSEVKFEMKPIPGGMLGQFLHPFVGPVKEFLEHRKP